MNFYLKCEAEINGEKILSVIRVDAEAWEDRSVRNAYRAIIRRELGEKIIAKLSPDVIEYTYDPEVEK